MKIQRSWVTPITAGAFLLSGVTGILIFFHMETGANKFVHEWLGWLLVAGAALHVVVNYAGFKSHLATSRGKVLLGVFAVALIARFIPVSGEIDEPPFMQPIRALSQAPLTTLAQVAQITPEQMHERMVKEGLLPTSDQQSLSDLVGTDPRKQMHVLGKIMVAAE
jgi:phage FluMu protein gp41